MKTKKSAALVSIISNILLSIIKLIVGLISGSISILSEALHSCSDLMASFIAYFSVSKSDTPADNEHQFGHGKYEDMAGFIEAILIIISAFFILYAGFEKLIFKKTIYTFSVDAAFCVMFLSGIINFFIARYLIFNGKKTDSNALLGDGYHLMADVWTSFGLAFGLYIVKVTGYYILDPIIAIILAAMILKTGITLAKTSANNLLDSSLPDCEISKIKKILEEFKSHGLIGVKSIKTSKSGSIKNVVLVVYLPCKMTLYQTHSLCDLIEDKIENELTRTNVIIHAEPNCNCSKYKDCAILK